MKVTSAYTRWLAQQVRPRCTFYYRVTDKRTGASAKASIDYNTRAEFDAALAKWNACGSPWTYKPEEQQQ